MVSAREGDYIQKSAEQPKAILEVMTKQEWEHLKQVYRWSYSCYIHTHDGRERIFIRWDGKWHFVASRSITNVVEVDKTDQERLNSGEISPLDLFSERLNIQIQDKLSSIKIDVLKKYGINEPVI